MRKMLLAATAIALVFGAMPASAQSGNGPPSDPNGYYSQSDHDGYYDRDGHYVRTNGQGQDQNGNGPSDQGPNSGPPDQGYDNGGPPPSPYQQGAYEDNCRRSNNAAGTIFGAIVGGMLGNAVTRDMPCEDHGTAFQVYAEGLDGEIGHRYEWRHGDDYGYFVPEREFRRDGYICRSFTETTYTHGHNFTRSGTACRMRDGNWRFD